MRPGYLHLVSRFLTYCVVSMSVISASEPTFKLNPVDVCGEAPVELLVWIHSAPHNTKKRLAIRMTWGDTSSYRSIYSAKVIFFVGLPVTRGADNTTVKANSQLQHSLEYEQERYGDIVQGNFVDSYRNITHKAIHSLWWISKYCSNARLLMKVDDDILVNIFKLLPYLRLKQHKAFYPKSIISCNLWRDARPVRNVDSKWYISEEDYPETTYPPFCQGMVYFMTPDLVPRLYEASQHVPYLFMDDVFITGLVSQKLENPRVSFRKLSAEYARVYGVGGKVVRYVKLNKRRVTFVHTDTIDSFYGSWEILVNANTKWDINKFIVPKPTAIKEKGNKR